MKTRKKYRSLLLAALLVSISMVVM